MAALVYITHSMNAVCMHKNPTTVTNQASLQPRGPPFVCFHCNRDDCLCQYYKYVHKCFCCVANPRATDAAHKSINSPYHPDHYPSIPYLKVSITPQPLWNEHTLDLLSGQFFNTEQSIDFTQLLPYNDFKLFDCITLSLHITNGHTL